MEKICRISDLLEDVSSVKFLRDRLSLYGGTALTFIYSKEILCLPVDLDLNYRHMGTKGWGLTRILNEIDDRIKTLLYRQGYKESDILISPYDPFDKSSLRAVQYTNALGSKDRFNIKIGYTRRIPILKTDVLADFRHIYTQETFPIKTPTKEELFANKWCTLLYRGLSDYQTEQRDLLDVYQIANMKMDLEIFRKCSIVDSLMRGKPKLYEINIEEKISQVRIDSSLKNLLQTEQLAKLNFKEIAEKAREFSREVLKNLTKDEIKAIDKFFQLKRFEPNLIDKEGVFHKKLKDHPALLEALACAQVKKYGR